MKFLRIAASVFSLPLLFVFSTGHASSAEVPSSLGNMFKQPYITLAAYSRDARYRASSRYKRTKKYRRSGGSLPSRIKALGVRVFMFSPRQRAWGAYSASGVRVGHGRASGGAHWCPDIGRSCRTPRGTFYVRSKGSPSCRSGTYPKPRGGAPMPYCMFYSKYYAIHGSPNVPNYNVSHGCIRVKPHAARWLSHNFIRIGTRVVVTSY